MPLVIIAIYVTVGVLTGIWHPTWVMFFIIPVYGTLASEIDKKRGIDKRVHLNKEYFEKDLTKNDESSK